MTIVTYDAIMQFAPCYNPIDIGMPIDYSDTLLNFVKEYRPKVRNLQDINWIACRFLDKKTRDYYAWWCVNEIKHLMKDKRSIKAVDTLKLYIDGRVTVQELKVAADAADAVSASASAAYRAAAAAYNVSAAAYDDSAYKAAAAAYNVSAAAYEVSAAAYDDSAYKAAAAAYNVSAAAADAVSASAAVSAKINQSNLQIDNLIKILEGK